MALEIAEMVCIMSVLPTCSPSESSWVIIRHYLIKDVLSNLGLVALFSGYFIVNINANCLPLVINALEN